VALDGRGLDQFANLVAEVIRLQVEVIVVPHATTAWIAKQATDTIPIVVVGAGSLDGLVASLARPGGNVTGVSNLSVEVATKRLELLKQVVPGVTRVAVLRGPTPQTGILPAMEAAAPALGVELHRFEVPEPTAFESAFASMRSAQVQALFVFGDPTHSPAYRQRIGDLAAQQHLPAVCAGRAYVEAGCFMSYGPSGRGRGQQIAAYVDKILRGARPADLPVEQAMHFEFVINLKTAQALGLTVPPVLLYQADEVIR
jgi:putative ABC transport system substrate-binding protein